MAEKKASQIAKEHGMSAMDLLMQLRDAGITVTAASALVDEDRVVEALGLSTAGASSAAFDFGQTASAVAAPPAPENGNATMAAPANGDASVPAPAADEQAPAPRARGAAGPRVIGADEFVPRPAAPIPLPRSPPRLPRSRMPRRRQPPRPLLHRTRRLPLTRRRPPTRQPLPTRPPPRPQHPR